MFQQSIPEKETIWDDENGEGKCGSWECAKGYQGLTTANVLDQL